MHTREPNKESILSVIRVVRATMPCKYNTEFQKFLVSKSGAARAAHALRDSHVTWYFSTVTYNLYFTYDNYLFQHSQV